jgi:hypothetical protein
VRCFCSATHHPRIAVSPDGKYLATADEQDVVQTWFLRPADLIDEACRRLTRDLTKDEWQQFVADGPYAPTCPPSYLKITVIERAVITFVSPS